MGWLANIGSRLNLGGHSRWRVPFPVIFGSFQKILEMNNQVLELMADMGDKLGGQFIFDRQYIISSCQTAKELVQQIIMELNKMAPKRYLGLYESFQDIEDQIDADLADQLVIPKTPYIIQAEELTREMVEVVGNKTARLAEAGQALGLNTPPGFMITTRAFLELMEKQGLRGRLQPTIERWQAGLVNSQEASQVLRPLILEAELPPGLERAIRQAAEQLQAQAGPGLESFAVRSSALGEDGELSFAGQYQSVLGVNPADLAKAYRQVLASAYSARALEYRRQWKVPEQQVAMAVGCQLMVDARAAGVLFTLDPQQPQGEAMLISAGFGLGEPVVSGRQPADHYQVSRQAPYTVLSLDVVRKESALMPLPGGGTESQPLGPGQESAPVLNAAQISRLAEIAARIENYFKKPQDIEWALDKRGELVVLQVRPLNLKSLADRLCCDIAGVLQNRPVLMSGRGSVAQRGIGAGKVFVVNRDEDLEAFPEGGILVTRFTSPRLGKVLGRARGVITDVGSPTGHLATIAREYRVPTIVGAGVATRLLKPGMEVTMDAGQNVIYEGTVKELCLFEFIEDAFEETEEYRLLGRVLRRVAALNLVDPQAPDFTPKGCRTLHDITRFAHEKAVEELISIESHHNPGAATKRLKLDIPLGLLVIDIGGGLSAPPGAVEISLHEVISQPTQALLLGMSEPGLWCTEPMSVDFGSFMSSVTRTFSASQTSPRDVGQNLAVVSRDYLNLNLRLGYHFNIVDAYVGENVSANYAYFRFQGGVTEVRRRARRARFISDVLTHHDFRVEIRGDLVVGRIKKLPRSKMLEKLKLLGRLISFSRQLDVKMLSDEHMGVYLREFMEMNEGRPWAMAA